MRAPNTASKATDQSSERGIFFSQKPGYLILEDGTSWSGQMPDWQTDKYYGEVVFNTGMTGYVESLTDPSYSGQILIFTYPLIGNYGAMTDDSESSKIQVSGIIVSEAVTNWSHSGSEFSIIDWLKKEKVPLLSGVDTRALTKHLRKQGTMNGLISSQAHPKTSFKPIKPSVTVDKPHLYKSAGTKTVVLVDCGAKENILRSLLKLPLNVLRVPYNYDYTKEAYDGVVLSNGPGDPTDYPEAIDITRKAMKKGKPVFGICLGTQIMGLAAGAKTYKLKFGHRGHNHPCLELHDNHAYITSQNHGYAVDEKSLPKDWLVTFRNLNDGSVEGIAHKSKPFFSVQFHPEACPGPNDTQWLFDRFYGRL